MSQLALSHPINLTSLNRVGVLHEILDKIVYVVVVDNETTMTVVDEASLCALVILTFALLQMQPIKEPINASSDNGLKG